ncbi:MAG: hypothetical protein QOF46_3775, partial [Paraburkholderia sp.]|nr:hypothetical protein [Paraburkholderia sp.]
MRYPRNPPLRSAPRSLLAYFSLISRIAMSDSALATSANPVHLLWSILREQGFDAAARSAVELAAQSVTPQLHADLCASAGRFEEAYHSASQAQAVTNGVRHARLA